MTSKTNALTEENAVYEKTSQAGKSARERCELRQGYAKEPRRKRQEEAIEEQNEEPVEKLASPAEQQD